MISAALLRVRLDELRAEHERDSTLFAKIEAQLTSMQRTMDMRHGAIVELEELLKQCEEPTVEAHYNNGDTP